jgi:hypothetical protein
LASTPRWDRIDRTRARRAPWTSRLSVVDTVLGDVVSQLTAAQTSPPGRWATPATMAQRQAAARELAVHPRRHFRRPEHELPRRLPVLGQRLDDAAVYAKP